MFSQPDPFSSQRVEEFLEEFFINNQPRTTLNEQTQVNPNAQLINDMQKFYTVERKRYFQALQRVEDRLVEHR